MPSKVTVYASSSFSSYSPYSSNNSNIAANKLLPKEFWTIFVDHNLSLLEAFRQTKIPIKSNCNGKGLCGKCKIKVLKGNVPISKNDKKYFSQEELNQGWRLSCLVKTKVNLEVFIPYLFFSKEEINLYRFPLGNWQLIVDLGTTQIQAQAIDNQGVFFYYKALNNQIIYGTDIISRIEHALEKGTKEISEIIIEQIINIIFRIINAGNVNDATNNTSNNFTNAIDNIFIAGNSVMTSLFLNHDIKSFSSFPFKPVTNHPEPILYKNYNFIPLPLIDGFIGGDVFSGLFYLYKNSFFNDPFLLLDVGTNCEIVLFDGEALWVTSTAAGPAFEGASISIGMRAEKGAISKAKLSEDKKWQFEIIGGDHVQPIGICGTALISIISECLKHNLIDNEGTIIDNNVKNNKTDEENKIYLTNELFLTQQDIREFQLAKSAIKSGIEIIMDKANFKSGINFKPQLNSIILTGAFGSNISIEEAQFLNILPKNDNRFFFISFSNLCLDGLNLWIKEDKKKQDIFEKWLRSNMKLIELSLEENFQEKFILNCRLAK